MSRSVHHSRMDAFLGSLIHCSAFIAYYDMSYTMQQQGQKMVRKEEECGCIMRGGTGSIKCKMIRHWQSDERKAWVIGCKKGVERESGFGKCTRKS